MPKLLVTYGIIFGGRTNKSNGIYYLLEQNIWYQMFLLRHLGLYNEAFTNKNVRKKPWMFDYLYIYIQYSLFVYTMEELDT